MFNLFCTSFSNVRVRRWRFGFVALLLLVWLPAQADSNALSSHCSKNNSSGSSKNSVYICGSLSIPAGDTITLGSGTPTSITVTVKGSFKTDKASKINEGGFASNLTLGVSGKTDLGADSSLTANLTGAGDVTTGARSTVVGNIQTESADINVGDDSTVTGNITTMVGVITIGARSTVIGDLTTADGAINVGDDSTINGSLLSTNTGAITLGENVTVNGRVATTYHGSEDGAGAITIGSYSNVIGDIITNTGAITVNAGKTGKKTNVCGNVATNDGAITVGADATVCKSVCTGNTGAITVGAGATVGGNVETANAGAITVGTEASIKGSVTVQKAGEKTVVDGAKVGSTMIGDKCLILTQLIPIPLKIKSREWRQIFMR